MNLIVKLPETASRGPTMAAGVKQPTTRAFIDDLTITANTVNKERWRARETGVMSQNEVQASKIS
jgi:hypothetical protein